MDENPCGEVSLGSDADLAPNYAGLALEHTMRGNASIAERCLRMIPRTKRGEVNIALEDLAMQLSRLGN